MAKHTQPRHTHLPESSHLAWPVTHVCEVDGYTMFQLSLRATRSSLWGSLREGWRPRICAVLCHYLDRHSSRKSGDGCCFPFREFSLCSSLQSFVAQLGFNFIFRLVSPLPLLHSPGFLCVSPLLSHSVCLCVLLPVWVPAPTPTLPSLSFLPFSLPLRLSWDRSSGLVAICCLFLWGWDQMASNRSSQSPWLPGWQSTWERHILQPGAVRPFLRGERK